MLNERYNTAKLIMIFITATFCITTLIAFIHPLFSDKELPEDLRTIISMAYGFIISQLTDYFKNLYQIIHKDQDYRIQSQISHRNRPPRKKVLIRRKSNKGPGYNRLK